MSKQSRREPSELARQARQHLESLRAAGVEWAPAAPAPVPEPAVPGAAAAESAESLIPETREVLSVEQRGQALAVLTERVAGCTRCAELAATRTQTVFGVGRLDAELCFVGEAPGAEEDARGEPFVGAAGQLLDRIIAACGMKR